MAELQGTFEPNSFESQFFMNRPNFKKKKVEIGAIFAIHFRMNKRFTLLPISKVRYHMVIRVEINERSNSPTALWYDRSLNGTQIAYIAFAIYDVV